MSFSAQQNLSTRSHGALAGLAGLGASRLKSWALISHIKKLLNIFYFVISYHCCEYLYGCWCVVVCACGYGL
jgi:hypothetical protein